MKNYSRLLLVSVSLLLTACDLMTPPAISKVKDTPETQKMLAEFATQEHRFEFSGCGMSYNDKPFDLNTSIKEIENMLGPYSNSEKGYKGERIYYWMDGVIKVFESGESNTVSAFIVKLENLKSSQIPFYFLVEGVPLDNKMTMGEFMGTSSYDYSNFYIGNSSYRLVFQECAKPISYYFSSDVRFSYVGNGHARIKDKPDFENTSPVTSLQISFYE